MSGRRAGCRRGGPGAKIVGEVGDRAPAQRCGERRGVAGGAHERRVGTESRRLVERLFGGRAAPLFAHLAQSEALTEQDIAEIERLLAELKK